MDEKLRRWSLLVFWSLPEVQRLHEKERELSRLGKSWEQVFSTVSEGLMEVYQLRPYWDPRMPEGEYGNRLREFNRMIYPVWAKTWETWRQSWSEPHSRPEVEVLHECDIAIYKSGIKPDRFWAGSMDDIRKKEAKAQKYGKQFAEAMG